MKSHPFTQANELLYQKNPPRVCDYSPWTAAEIVLLDNNKSCKEGYAGAGGEGEMRKSALGSFAGKKKKEATRQSLKLQQYAPTYTSIPKSHSLLAI